MEKCLVCKNTSEETLLQKVGKCESHRLCTTCFDTCIYDQKDLQGKCKFCVKFFTNSRFIPKLPYCSYCTLKFTRSEKDRFCQAHSPCKNCILEKFRLSNKPNIRNCYQCYYILDTHCRECFADVRNKSIVSDCGHFYCANCELNFKMELKIPTCIDCSKFYTDMNRCVICKGHPQTISYNSCNFHKVCSECYYLFASNISRGNLQYTSCSLCTDFLCNAFSISQRSLTLQKSLDTPQLTSRDILSSENIIVQNYQQSGFIVQYFGKCCGGEWGKMECGHPMCEQCISQQFLEKFEGFLKKLLENDIENLNASQESIGCPRKGCYNKLSIPFGFVSKYAQGVLLNHGMQNTYINIFTNRFGPYFEGVPMKFKICPNCQRTTDGISSQLCYWCSYYCLV